MKTYLFTTWYENDKNRELKVRFNSLEYAIKAFNEAIKHDEKCRIYKITEKQCGIETELICSYK